MTDENPTPETEETQEPTPAYAQLATLWNIYYQSITPTVVGDTANKRDIQQYRLKAMDLAYALTELTLRIGLKPGVSR